jgi:prepilin-type N-terminal cleavage/methylation domain-containing protein
MRRRQHGFTLLETAMALAVALMALIAALKLGSDARLRSRTAADVQHLTQFIAAVRGVYGLRGGATPYAGLSVGDVLARNLVPAGLNAQPGVIQGFWGGSIVPYPSWASATAPAGVSWLMVITRVAHDVCVQMAPALLEAVDILAIGPGGGIDWAGLVWFKSAGSPNPDPADVAGGCGPDRSMILLQWL